MQHHEEVLRQKYTNLLARAFRVNVPRARAIAIKVADWEVLIEECEDVLTKHAADQARASLLNKEVGGRSKRPHGQPEVEEGDEEESEAEGEKEVHQRPSKRRATPRKTAEEGDTRMSTRRTPLTMAVEVD